MMGAYGYMKDAPVQQYLRDIRAHRILEGTPYLADVQRVRSPINGRL